MQDCLDSQNPQSGNISDGAPKYGPGVTGGAQIDWSAALIVTPWTIWRRYGDAQPITEYYDELRLYMTLYEALPDQMAAWEKNGGARPYRIIGDWVAIEKGTTLEFIGRAVGYMLSQHMTDFARLTNNAKDIETFTKLAARYRQEIIDKHIAPDGKLNPDTQCAYAYVTRYGLYMPEQKAAIRANFQRRMEADSHTVKTGFHGTGNLLQALSAMGLNADASKTVLSEKSLGWGAMVRRGATRPRFGSAGSAGRARTTRATTSIRA